MSDAVLNRYTSDSWSLELSGEASPLSRWTRKPVVKGEHFKLSLLGFETGAAPISWLEGDRPLLEDLHRTVEAYVQSNLQKPSRSGGGDGVRAAEGMAVLEPTGLSARSDSALSDSDVIQMVPGAAGSSSGAQGSFQLESDGSVAHRLHYHPAGTQARTLKLSTLQLADLLEVLDRWQAESMALPQEGAESATVSPVTDFVMPAWGRVAASALIALGAAAGGISLLMARPDAQVATSSSDAVESEAVQGEAFGEFGAFPQVSRNPSGQLPNLPVPDSQTFSAPFLKQQASGQRFDGISEGSLPGLKSGEVATPGVIISDPTALDPSAIASANIDSSALDPTALDPTALDPSAIIAPTAIDPTSIDPSALEPSISPSIDAAALESAIAEAAIAEPSAIASDSVSDSGSDSTFTAISDAELGLSGAGADTDISALDTSGIASVPEVSTETTPTDSSPSPFAPTTAFPAPGETAFSDAQSELAAAEADLMAQARAEASAVSGDINAETSSIGEALSGAANDSTLATAASPTPIKDEAVLSDLPLTEAEPIGATQRASEESIAAAQQAPPAVAPAPVSAEPVAIAPPPTGEVQSSAVKTYFESRWTPPADLNQSLQYQLIVSNEGSIEKMNPLSPAATQYAEQAGIPSVGEPFIPASGKIQDATLVLTLSEDGSVDVSVQKVTPRQ